MARKHLMVDADKVRELARRRDMSESEAVREAIEHALAAEDVMDGIRELHARGGIDDVFGRLPDEADCPASIPDLHYSIVIDWSDEDQVFIVSLPEWGDLVHTHGATYEEALQQGKALIEGLIAVRQERGEPVPTPRVFASV